MAFLLVGIFGSEKIGEDNPHQLKTSTNPAFIPFDRDHGFRDRDRRFRAKPEIGHDQTESSVTFDRKSRSRWSGIRTEPRLDAGNPPQPNPAPVWQG
jgi:hypothetical protein